MQYTFALRRTTGLLLLAGLAVCFALTFLVGWVVGLNPQVSTPVADGRTVRVRAEREGSRTLYQVQVGPYERRRRAVQHVDSVRTYTGNALVVQIRPTP